jgi:hypothetical protein
VVEGGLKLAELGRLAGGIDDATVSNRVRPFETAHTKHAKLKDLVKQPLRYLEKEKL